MPPRADFFYGWNEFTTSTCKEQRKEGGGRGGYIRDVIKLDLKKIDLVFHGVLNSSVVRGPGGRG